MQRPWGGDGDLACTTNTLREVRGGGVYDLRDTESEISHEE